MSHQASLRRSSTISLKRAGARGRSRYFHLVKTKGKNIECVAQTRTEITFRLGSSKTRRSLWGKNPIRPCVEIRTDPADFSPHREREREMEGRAIHRVSRQDSQMQEVAVVGAGSNLDGQERTWPGHVGTTRAAGHPWMRTGAGPSMSGNYASSGTTLDGNSRGLLGSYS